ATVAPGRHPEGEGAVTVSRDDLLRVDPHAEAVVTGDGRVLLRNGRRTVVARGLPPGILRELAEAVGDGWRSRGEVVALLAARYPREWVDSLLRGLTGMVLATGGEEAAPTPPPSPTAAPASDAAAARVVVLGDGALAARLA